MRYFHVGDATNEAELQMNDLVAELSGGLVQHSLFYWIFQQHITLQIERTVVWLYEKPKRAWTNHVVSDSSSDTVVKRVKSFRCHTKTVLSTLFLPGFSCTLFLRPRLCVCSGYTLGLKKKDKWHQDVERTLVLKASLLKRSCLCLWNMWNKWEARIK